MRAFRVLAKSDWCWSALTRATWWTCLRATRRRRGASDSRKAWTGRVASATSACRIRRLPKTSWATCVHYLEGTYSLEQHFTFKRKKKRYIFIFIFIFEEKLRTFLESNWTIIVKRNVQILGVWTSELSQKKRRLFFNIFFNVMLIANFQFLSNLGRRK